MEVAIPSFTKISSCSDEEILELRRGPWTLEEDTLLIHYIACHGEGRWNMLAKRSGLKRNGKSCRLRWLNYLKPDVKRGNLTPQEQLLILELHSKWGNRWSKIAQHLPGRTDNEIKNYWRTRVQKQAKHLKIDSNSTAFQELIRCLWMPRLLQKIQSSSSSSSSSYQNSTNVSSLNLPQVALQVTMDLECKKDFALENRTMVEGEPKYFATQIPASPTFRAMATEYNETNDVFSSLMPDSALGTEYFLEPMSDQNSLENNWIDYQMEDSLWNIDNFWQLGERNT